MEGENDTVKVFERLRDASEENSILLTLSKVHGPWAFAYWQVSTTIMSTQGLVLGLLNCSAPPCVYIHRTARSLCGLDVMYLVGGA